MTNLLDYGIQLRNQSQGNHKTTCPQCSHTRRNKKDPCLSVTITEDGAVWNCHHCQWNGGFNSNDHQSQEWKPRPKTYKRPEFKPQEPTNKLFDFAAKRGIEELTVEKFGVSVVDTWMPGCERGQKVKAIAFPYFKDGEVVNVKYRTPDKKFRQEKDAEKVFFNLDAITGIDTVVICEGEWDCMIFDQCGYTAVSVPDGAPKQAVAENSSKFEYVDNCIDLFEGKTIVLATDGDAPGLVLREELARRFGFEYCKIVEYPDGCKDANDVFLKLGKQGVQDLIDQAQHFPVDGIVQPYQDYDGMLDLYMNGRQRGLTTGWPRMDDILTVRMGDVWVVTGAPNNGKSEWLDALAVNLVDIHGVKVAQCSFENEVREHTAKLMEKKIFKPFHDGQTQRMSIDEMGQGYRWIEDHFSFIKYMEEVPPTIDWVLEKARILIKRRGIRMLIVDPYNEIQKETASQSETEFVSEMMGKLRRFAQKYGILVVLVAHPQKLQRGQNGEYPVPSLYDISGGANFNNKCDVGVAVQRRKDFSFMGTTVHVHKVRRKEIGTQGTQDFKFDLATGTYTDIDEVAVHQSKNGF